MWVKFIDALSEDSSLILIVVTSEVGQLNRHPNILESFKIIRECWRMIPVVFIEIFMEIKVLVVFDRQLSVIEVDLFDRVE